MLIGLNLKSLSLVLVMISSNRFHATRANSSKITILGGYPSLTPDYVRLLEPRGSGLGLLKFTFNAKNFVCKLSRFISSHFIAIQCRNVRCIQKLRKFTKNPFWGFKVV